MQQAIRALRFTLPLEPDDPRYVARVDAFAARLRSHLTAPSASRVLIAGTPGCGKSTELARLPRVLDDGRRTLLLRADREIDLLRPTMKDLDLALLREAERIGLPLQRLASPGAIPWKMVLGANQPNADEQRVDIVRRLFEEERRGSHGDLALFIDGLEKLSIERLDFLDEVLARPEFRSTQFFVVVPHWRLYGWSSLRAMDDVETIEVAVDAGSSFVAEVLQRRAGEVLDQTCVLAIASLCGGVVRDGLQIALNACRYAMERGAARVELVDMVRARVQMREFFEGLFSDQSTQVQEVLRHVGASGQFPDMPSDLRDRLLAAGAVLWSSDRRFVVHPAAWVAA